MRNGEHQGRTTARTSDQILGEIRDYCRATQTAESTFGRLVVNDGKLVSRLRDGAKITTGTLDKVRAYLTEHRAAPPSAQSKPPAAVRPVNGAAAAADVAPPGFRFFDNRQKYLLFVSTCSEKTEVANRISLELGNLQPSPPALRIFDAGVGDGTVLSRVMRALHARFPDHAALCRGQGNQLRRRAADAGEDGGPPVRASGHRAGHHQSLLCRGAVADAALGDLGAGPDLEGRRAVRQYRARLCRADRRTRRVFWPRTGAPGSVRPPAIRSIRGPSS